MSGPAPAVAQVRSAVRGDLSDLAADLPGALVLAACSGGADSLALASALAFVAPRVGLRAGAVVVDHRLQPGSAEVAATAAATCRGLGLEPVRVVAVEVGRRGGPEAAARVARYAALEAAAQRDGAAAVLLGHNRDDQAETVLLGLARGSGPRSLAGMADRRGLLHRPLLALGRQTTARACQELGLVSWQDPANTDPALLRSVVRASTLPTLERDLGPGVAAALARTAALAREDCDALDALAEELLARAVSGPAVSGPAVGGPPGCGPPGGDGFAPGELRLDVQVLAAAPAAVRRRSLLAAARRAGSPAGSLSRVHAVALDARVARWSGQGPVRLPGRVEVVRCCGTLVLRSAQHPEE